MITFNVCLLECNCNPAGLVAEFGGCDKVQDGKLCECKERVKGRICNQCKDLYWNLQMQNPYGCEECLCNKNGTISQIGLCDSSSGQCICKHNVQGSTCNTCKKDTYMLEDSNLLGCLNCNCDVGGAIRSECDKKMGQCLCKPRLKGRQCSETIEGNYFPTFFQFLYEAEDWYNPTGSQARFGYDEEVFSNHSWRGYAVFNQLQKEIFTNITIPKTSIYRVIVRYVNRNGETANGQLKFTPNGWAPEEEQTMTFSFEPTAQPKFVTSKQAISGSVALGAGPWKVTFKVDKYDFYVDYIVLIPQAYYDYTLFQEKIADACLYSSTETLNASCVQYTYPNYPENVRTIRTADGYTNEGESERRPSLVQSPEYLGAIKTDIPLVKLDQSQNNLMLDIPRSENNETYLVSVNYHTNGNRNKTVNLDLSLLDTDLNQTTSSALALSACPYLIVCRHIVTLEDGRLLLLDGSKNSAHQLRLLLRDQADPLEPEGDLHINSITLIPFDSQWSFDYVKPKFVCIHNGTYCVLPSFNTLLDAQKVEAEVENNRENAVEVPDYKHSQPGQKNDQKPLLIKLGNSTQTVDIRGQVPEEGSYSFVLHYYQPNSSSFRAEILIQNGQFYSGVADIEHCPNIAGCRVVLRQRDTESLYFYIQKNFMITLRPSKGHDLYLDYIMVVPGSDYKPQILASDNENLNAFMTKCNANSMNYFYIDPELTNGKSETVVELVSFFCSPLRRMSICHILHDCCFQRGCPALSM